MFMELKFENSEMKHHFRPLFDSRDENKNCTILLHFNKTETMISFVFTQKCKWSSSDKPCLTENVIVRSSHDKMKIDDMAKWKFCILTEHLQDMSNHTLEYQLSTPEHVDLEILGKKETSFSDPHLIPRDKVKIPKPYFTSKKFVLSCSRILFFFSWKCRQTSNDKNFTKSVIFWPLITSERSNNVMCSL